MRIVVLGFNAEAFEDLALAYRTRLTAISPVGAAEYLTGTPVCWASMILPSPT